MNQLMLRPKYLQKFPQVEGTRRCGPQGQQIG